jgi:uncharacterized DUF497 family protein
MEMEFDKAKDRRNRAKHGLSLGFAARLNWDSMLVQVDDKEDCGEERWIGVAPREGRLYTVVFTMRDDEIPRIISLRRATNTEIERYETQGHE